MYRSPKFMYSCLDMYLLETGKAPCWHTRIQVRQITFVYTIFVGHQNNFCPNDLKFYSTIWLVWSIWRPARVQSDKVGKKTKIRSWYTMLHGIAQFNVYALNIADWPLSISTARSSFDLLLVIKLYRLGVFGFSVGFVPLWIVIRIHIWVLSAPSTQVFNHFRGDCFSSFLSRNKQRPRAHTIKVRSSLYQKKWQLSCNPFWCKLTLNFLLKQL